MQIMEIFLIQNGGSGEQSLKGKSQCV